MICMFVLFWNFVTGWLLFLKGHIDKHVSSDGIFNTFERTRLVNVTLLSNIA